MKTSMDNRRLPSSLRKFGILAGLCFISTVAFGQATDVDCTQCVDRQDLASKAVTSGKLGSGAVTNQKLAKDAVTTNKIKNQSVSRSKIRAGAVTEGKLSQDLKNRLDTMDSRFQYVAVPGAVVRSSNPSGQVTILANGALRAAQTGDLFLIGGVQLPDGMEVQTLSCWVLDNNSSAYIQANLLRANLLDPGYGFEVIAAGGTFPTFTDPDYQVLSRTANAAVAIVDNSPYSYVFRVDMLDLPSSNSSIEFRGCSIELAP